MPFGPDFGRKGAPSSPRCQVRQEKLALDSWNLAILAILAPWRLGAPGASLVSHRLAQASCKPLSQRLKWPVAKRERGSFMANPYLEITAGRGRMEFPLDAQQVTIGRHASN